MPDLPWQGEYVRVDEQRRVTFRRCVICGRPLKDEVSTYFGVGPDCAERLQATWDVIDQAAEEARQSDRARWRRERRQEQAREADRAAGRLRPPPHRR